MFGIVLPVVVCGILALRATKEKLLIKKEFTYALILATTGIICIAALQGLATVFPDTNFNWPTIPFGSLWNT